MIQNLTTLVSLGSLLVLMYGVLQLITWPAPQECRMTYMFQYPQFTRIVVPNTADRHPRYKLFAYSEGGSETVVPPPPSAGDRTTGRYTGAPVLFVHGNAGSHKQMRSLASVALRKAIDLAGSRRARHLDYFAVDYNEEFSALFGGYLQPQADYLTHCVHTISDLYPAGRRGLIVVAHSMGGKVVQAALQHANVSALVHTVLMIAAPVDRPVIDVDFYTSALYRRVDAYWERHRSAKWVATNTTSTCCHPDPTPDTAVASVEGTNARLLDHVLLVTIGGGVRDRLVHAGLTASRFSDVHAMSNAIPDVWLSTDHLCSVWCLQQVLVINRFLFDIIDSGTGPAPTKEARLEAARRHFAPQQLQRSQRTVQLIEPAAAGETAPVEFADSEWQEDSRRQFTERYPAGFALVRTQMIRLVADAQYRYLDVQLVNAPLDEQAGWLFGCAALESNRVTRFCSRADRLDGYATRIPSQQGGDRVVLQLDLHALKRAHRDWTHLLIRTAPTKESFHFTVDIHGDRREVHVQMPKWYSFAWSAPLIETDLRATSLRLLVSGLVESYQSLEVEVVGRPQCEPSVRHVTALVCVPWTVGFVRHHHFIDQHSANLFVDVPVDKPSGYNTTEHPVTVDFRIESACQLTVRVRNSFARTAANIVQQFGHWLPAHLAAVLLLALKHQLTVTPKNEPFKSAPLCAGILRSSSFFIITASRVFVKMIQWTKAMPDLDGYEHSMVVSVLLHGAAAALLVLLSTALNGVVRAGGSLLFRMRNRGLQCCPLPAGMWSMVVKLPTAIGTVLLGIVMSTCGGLALLLACVFYLFILMVMHSNYLFELQVAEATPADRTATPNPTEEPHAALLNGETHEIRTGTPIEEECVKPSEAKTTRDAVADRREPTDAADDDDEAAPSTAALDEAIGQTDEERLNDEELNRLIRETMEQRKKSPPSLISPTDEAQRRAEYEAMDVRQNAVHFHSSLFVGLLVLTLLNGPSVLAWSRNIPFSYSLATDPSFIPAVISVLSLVVMWQINAPRQINGYSPVGSMLYLMAALCILYGQDSVYRLNAFLAATFVCLAAHQWMSPLHVPATDVDAPQGPKKKPLTPAEIDEMLEKIMEAERIDRAQRTPDTDEEDELADDVDAEADEDAAVIDGSDVK